MKDFVFDRLKIHAANVFERLFQAQEAIARGNSACGVGFTIAIKPGKQKAAEDVQSFELSPLEVATNPSATSNANVVAVKASEDAVYVSHETPVPTQAWVDPADVSDMAGVLEELRAISALLRG